MNRKANQTQRATIWLIHGLAVGLACLWALPALSQGPGESTVPYEAGLYYTIKKGDTLWDISKRFNDSPTLWPELWKENKQIANPHWIFPGERIRLFHHQGVKEVVQAPAAAAVQPPAPAPPPPKYYTFRGVDGIGFIRSQPAPALGKLIKTHEDNYLIGEKDKVTIQPEPGAELVVGQQYLVYMLSKPIRDSESKRIIGVQHYPTGLVRIDKIEPKVALGEIVKAFRPIGVGNLIMPYTKRSAKIELKAAPAGIRAKIISSEENDTMMGDTFIAYIDRGSRDGLAPGQQLGVYEQHRQRLEGKERQTVMLPPVDQGKVLVLHTEETTATVLITDSLKELMPGALVGTLATP